MEKAYFGFKEVDAEQKQSLVGKVFSSVAPRYDIMNDVMSMGIHHLWKNKLISKVRNLSGKFLDVAGGTGDISFRLHKKIQESNIAPDITICDINQDMLDVAEKKAIDHNILSGLKFKQGNAEELPFDEATFDCYIISFGIRNVTNIDKALSEAYRVLKPGGKFLCLEFSSVNNVVLKKIYDLYSLNIIPKIGKFIANDEDSYRYLAESIRKFPNQQRFLKMLKDSGFKNSKYTDLSCGIVAMHEGEKA